MGALYMTLANQVWARECGILNNEKNWGLRDSHYLEWWNNGMMRSANLDQLILDSFHFLPIIPIFHELHGP
jgi:hypothetical protein